MTSGDSDMKEKEHMGIPEAIFIEDAEKYLQDHKFNSYVEALKDVEERYQKYKYMDTMLRSRRQRLLLQIPDITKTLAVVKHLETVNEPFETTFEVADQIFSKAKIEKTDHVGLWLGANVMLEYSLDEALQILVTNQGVAEKSLATVEENLEFLKDQMTTSEVNIARLYNLTVKANKQVKQ